MAAPNAVFVCAVTSWRPARTWLPPRPTTTAHRTSRGGAKLTDTRGEKRSRDVNRANRRHGAITSNHRTGLHLRRAHKERHAVLAPRTWTSTLLATQRNACDAAAG